MTLSDESRYFAGQASTHERPRRSQFAPLSSSVHCLAGRASPESLMLREERIVIGASGDSDIVVDEPMVSRRHAELRLVPEGVRVRDLGSKNGLYHQGRRFESMVLPPGSRFLAGTVEFEYRASLPADYGADGGIVESYGDLVGSALPMRTLFRQLTMLERSTVNVLIRGDSGTGKELVARAIHEHSRLREGPMVTVNCATLEPNLARSELFGHERGAFTGAEKRRVGAFRSAERGTLFLDEVAELSLQVQPLLLRALEAGHVAPVGACREELASVRLIAASHRDLAREVREGRFREDLFYRIRVVQLELPPLKNRAEDIALLAQRFAAKHGPTPLPTDFIEVLKKHHWPGNARELRNAVEAYLALGSTPDTDSRSATSPEPALASFVDASVPYAQQKEELLRLFTRAYLQRLLEITGGNQSEAARRSGLQRTYLVKLLGKLGLRK